MTRRLIMPFPEWPFIDRQLWQNARQRGGILDDAGPAAAWREKSVRTEKKSYGLWLQYLTDNDLLDPDARPCERFTEAAIAGYFQDLQKRLADRSVVGRLESLGRMVSVMQPGYRNKFLRELIQRLKRRMKPHRDKASRLHHPSDILKAVTELMRQEQAMMSTRGRKASTHYRTALIIAILTTVPLRLANITNLRLGINLIRNGSGFDLYIPGQDYKTSRPFSGVVADQLIPFLDFYLEQVRPKLIGDRETDAVWVTYRYGKISEQTVYCSVTQMTEELFGQPIYPHLFRDNAATWFAINDPGHVRAASAVLGHRSMRTGEKHYNQADMLEAVRQFQKGAMAATSTD